MSPSRSARPSCWSRHGVDLRRLRGACQQSGRTLLASADWLCPAFTPRWVAWISAAPVFRSLPRLVGGGSAALDWRRSLCRLRERDHVTEASERHRAVQHENPDPKLRKMRRLPRQPGRRGGRSQGSGRQPDASQPVSLMAALAVTGDFWPRQSPSPEPPAGMVA
jgi:hypothetical protein